MNDREKLIELLKNTEITRINGHRALAEVCFTPHVFENMADHLLANGVTVQRWIPVTERLPEKSGDYLVYTYNGCIERLHYAARHKAFNADDAFIYAECAIPCTHWMPLPEPPKEDAE